MACPVVLTLLRYYLPGFKAGGPARSLSNIVEALGDEFEFRILTSDRDVLDAEAYPGIATDQWAKAGKAWVRYIPPPNQTFSAWIKLLRLIPYDLLYLNSVFDPVFTVQVLLARAIERVSNAPVVVAPRGELFPGAVSLKSWKKKPFLFIARRSGLYRRVIWQASTSDEAGWIRQQFGAAANVFVARDLASQTHPVCVHDSDQRSPEPLRIVFLSRISRNKNLDFALKVLAAVRVDARLDIWGPREDTSYWRECEPLIQMIPENIKVSYRGVADHSRVMAILSASDLFFLPSLGENFGHAIAEALAVGTPLLLSNRTPWRNLHAHGVGWDLSLEDGEAPFSRAIEAAAARTKSERKAWRRIVLQYAAKHVYSPEALEANRQLFRQAIGETA